MTNLNILLTKEASNIIFLPNLPRSAPKFPVENLRLSTTADILKTDRISIRKDICERYLIKLKAHSLESEPPLEVIRDPRDGKGYIALLTSLTHPISVFEPVPISIFDEPSDRKVEAHYFGARVRLKEKLKKLEQLLSI